MVHNPVFFDPTRRRWWWIKRVGTLLGLIAVSVVSVFLFSVFAATPLLPELPLSRAIRRSIPHRLRLPSHSARMQQYAAQKTLGRLRKVLADEQKARRARAALPPVNAANIVAAFYAPWQTTGIHALRQLDKARLAPNEPDPNAPRLTHIFPIWAQLGADGSSLDFRDYDLVTNPTNEEVLSIARANNLNIVPVFSNANAGRFDGSRARVLLRDTGRQQRVIAALRNWVLANRFHGINVDLENLERQDYPLYVQFLGRLHASFAEVGLQVSADLEAGKPVDFRAAAAACDFVVVMIYDLHGDGTPAGPISPVEWYRTTLARAAAAIPAHKLVVGLANYAYDWAEDDTEAEPLTYQQALLRARENRPDEAVQTIIDFDADSLNPSYEYEDDEGTPHTVWMLDAVTAANQWTIARDYAPRGVAVWALGMTDPTVWRVLDRDRLMRPVDVKSLQSVSFGSQEVEFAGDGEVARILASPSSGERTLEADSRSGLITDEIYSSFPTSYVIGRSGYHPKLVALTIDDGPAEPYTRQILDQLEKLGVKATFFMIGENAEKHPDLVRRIWADGHEIGNHSYTHPNLGAVPKARARLELNATQRVFQALLNRSTILFRPPYNADAEPKDQEEVAPLRVATELHYVTVLEVIDPQDWATQVRDVGGKGVRARTAEEMLASALRQIETEKGSCILLHDGGGDRQQTVRLIPMLVKELRARGYRFVNVSDLIGATRDQVNPRVMNTDTFMLASDRMVFESAYLLELMLSIAFISAIVLGTARVLFVTILAIAEKRRERTRVTPVDFSPSVTVVIAAFNEHKVIVRTVEAVLANDYPSLEVIVVDDGSSDDTAVTVEAAFGSRVRLIRQENAGKAAALNNGIGVARGEIIIALDADTIFAPDTIRRLVSRFADPEVGAVAGNVKVGNRVNPLTSWQAIEYITSQNLDRRAYALINSVPVVPGAVGAWRRTAILQAGGYTAETLAEDMDLTWRIRRHGWRIDTDSEALGFTEAPDSLRALFKQRFRWAFGTLQCLWKHKDALGRHGWFGRVVLPSLWLFQIVYQAISPLVDLQILWSVFAVVASWAQTHTMRELHTLPQALEELSLVAFMYGFFFAVELVGSVIAFHLDREDKRMLVWLFWQRFLYRQLMYAVLLKSIKTAISGMRAGWGKLERKGTVELAEA